MGACYNGSWHKPDSHKTVSLNARGLWYAILLSLPVFSGGYLSGISPLHGRAKLAVTEGRVATISGILQRGERRQG